MIGFVLPKKKPESGFDPEVPDFVVQHYSNIKIRFVIVNYYYYSPISLYMTRMTSLLRFVLCLKGDFITVIINDMCKEKTPRFGSELSHAEVKSTKIKHVI